MLLDDIQNVFEEYHLIAWAIGCLATVAILTLIFKTVFGKWRWNKDKTPIRKSNKTIDQYRMGNLEEQEYESTMP